MKFAPFLLALLFAVGTNAGTNVIYQTGWEAAPASPAWVSEAVVYGQNNWVPPSPGDLSHRVVANGSVNSIVNGQAVVTPSGSQFHRFTASSSTTAENGRWAWVDFSSAFDARTTGYDLVKSSIDFFVPANQSQNDSFYGLDTYHGNNSAWFVVIQPPVQGAIFIGVDEETQLSGVGPVFDLNTWFNLTVAANYNSGEVTVAVDGEVIPELTKTSTLVASGGGLTDSDLYCQNSTTAPVPRVVFSDNYKITAEGADADPRPILTITPGPPGALGDPPLWHFSWSGVYFDWILESAQTLASDPLLTVWTNEGVSATVSGGVASVDVLEGPSHNFYRLRKP